MCMFLKLLEYSVFLYLVVFILVILMNSKLLLSKFCGNDLQLVCCLNYHFIFKVPQIAVYVAQDMKPSNYFKVFIA